MSGAWRRLPAGAGRAGGTAVALATALLATALLATAAALATAADEERIYRIEQGGHSSGGGVDFATLQSGTKVDRRLAFRAWFTPSAAYRTADPKNQGDWCKLMGLTTEDIHKNSIRLGWRWLPGEKKMELGFYGYIKGRRIDQAIDRTALEQWVEVELRLWNDGLSVTVGKKNCTKASSLGLSDREPTVTCVLNTAYFGGDEPAPQEMTVKVKDVSAK